jgi:hypothetical protein
MVLWEEVVLAAAALPVEVALVLPAEQRAVAILAGAQLPVVAATRGPASLPMFRAAWMWWQVPSMTQSMERKWMRNRMLCRNCMSLT